MFTVEFATDRQGHAVDLVPDQLDHCIPDDIGLIWVDAQHPSAADIEKFRELFTLHPLAVEDISQPHQRPKMEVYGDDVFIVFYAISLVDGQLVTHEIDIFIGQNYLLTIHEQPLPLLATVTKRWRENPRGVKHRTSGMLLYALLDEIVDDYFPVLDTITDTVEDLDDHIFTTGSRQTQKRILALRRTLLIMRRLLGPERDLLALLIRRDTPVFDERSVLYFQDVFDHVLRATDVIDNARDMLTTTMDVHLTVISNDLNQIMKRLTAASIILMSVALIPAIYGMNFVNMPELSWPLGYPLALIAMVALGVGGFFALRRIDWV